MSNSPSRLGTGKSVQLHNNGLTVGSLIDQSIANLTEEQAQNLMDEARKIGLHLERKKREQFQDHVAATREIENHLEIVRRLPVGPHRTESYMKTGAGHTTIRSGCFVATVAYGDRNHPDVVLLRKFRDEVLTRSSAGRRFIDWSWRTGPYLARCIRQSPHLRYGSRWLISCLVSLIRKHF
jgi:hypothetical protein